MSPHTDVDDYILYWLRPLDFVFFFFFFSFTVAVNIPCEETTRVCKFEPYFHRLSIDTYIFGLRLEIILAVYIRMRKYLFIFLTNLRLRLCSNWLNADFDWTTTGKGLKDYNRRVVYKTEIGNRTRRWLSGSTLFSLVLNVTIETCILYSVDSQDICYLPFYTGCDFLKHFLG